MKKTYESHWKLSLGKGKKRTKNVIGELNTGRKCEKKTKIELSKKKRGKNCTLQKGPSNLPGGGYEKRKTVQL